MIKSHRNFFKELYSRFNKDDKIILTRNELNRIVNIFTVYNHQSNNVSFFNTNRRNKWDSKN